MCDNKKSTCNDFKEILIFAQFRKQKQKALTPLPSSPAITRAKPYHATENDDCKYAILSFVLVVIDPYSRISALSLVVLVN